MWRFAKAIWVGSIVGAAAPTCLAALLGGLAVFQPGGSVLGGVLFILLPLGLSLAIVVGASAVVGIPCFLVLRKLGLESRDLYATIGGVAGLAVAIGLAAAIRLDQDFWWLVVIGPFSGVATALTWWSARPRTPGKNIW